MTGLDWFQARALARGGKAVRRDAWRKWLTRESYVWLITQPAWEAQLGDRRVAQQWDFGANEFFAHDWTDEPWPDGPLPPVPVNPPTPPDPPRPPAPSFPTGGSASGNDESGDESPSAQPPSSPIGGAGGSSGNGNSGSTGGSSGSGGGGSGIGWPPGSGGGGPQPPVPPKPLDPHQPPAANVPVITVEVFVDINTDGPACFIHPPETCTAFVNVTVAGGPAGVGSLSVSGPGTPSPQVGTGWPGMSQGFTFKNVPVNPGGTITFTADYGAPGTVPLTHYVATGDFTFPPLCLLFTATFTGTCTEDKVCGHNGPSGHTEDGWHFTANYHFAAQYAVHPDDGNGKRSEKTGVDLVEGEPRIHWENETLPDHTHTEGDIPVTIPAALAVDVNAGGVSNPQPPALNLFGPDQHTETTMPPCTFDKETDESITV